ncbi:hypothetical protein OIDMADRAFT_136454 [Oidiodendron maius Zn]|uniref:Trichothecene 3-O-acetyltransferase-like N-terminal domain-containing protein n=1 Tax=Oidiodendron maius (strain Zn) TaxID=913774 RepID=A0A0C3C5D9_OIDMZ|nr:hypothetical protein OIDMADRAFT_136454 [Oidiodendron maius Zn]
MDDYTNFARYQDIFGQLRLLKSYTHFLICFPISEGTTQESVIHALKSACLDVTTTFPWLSGKVISEGSGPSSSGLFKVAHCAIWEPPNTILRVKDCSNLCHSFEEIMSSKGPIKFFDPAILAPCVAFPQSYQETDDDPACVLALQANFVKGGLLLDIAAQHNIMPGGGILQFLALLAKVMRGESITSFEIEQGNRDRRNMIKLLGPGESSIDLSRYHRPSLLGIPIPAVPAPNGKWCTFRFTPEKMIALKALASDSSNFVNGITFISSNDTLTAFVWKRITAIRLRRLADNQAMSKFVRAVDVRSTMGIPIEYMGHMVYNTYSTLSLETVDQAPLATLASVMRKNLLEDVNEHAVRSFVTLLDRTPDKTTIMYGGDMNPDTDVAFTSIAQSDIYNVSFGILGKPALLRRPNFIPRTTTAIMFPKTLDGNTDFLVCLSEEDLEQLKADPEWSFYTELIDKD